MELLAQQVIAACGARRLLTDLTSDRSLERPDIILQNESVKGNSLEVDLGLKDEVAEIYGGISSRGTYMSIKIVLSLLAGGVVFLFLSALVGIDWKLVMGSLFGYVWGGIITSLIIKVNAK